VIVSDLSRLLRDHIKLGRLLSYFSERGVELIAVNDGGKFDYEKEPFPLMAFREWFMQSKV
jgi:DNA invertase Pin-like site-specific DNA recombinase